MSDNEIRLKPKDGKTHVFFIHVAKTKILDNLDEIASNEVDRIIIAVQDRGYEIIDMKFATPEPGCLKVMVMYQ